MSNTESSPRMNTGTEEKGCLVLLTGPLIRQIISRFLKQVNTIDDTQPFIDRLIADLSSSTVAAFGGQGIPDGDGVIEFNPKEQTGRRFA